jgi:hypothetical protein
MNSKKNKEGWRFVNIGLFMMVNGALMLNGGNLKERLLFSLGWAIGTFLTRAQL